jgi:hypothetical protein
MKTLFKALAIVPVILFIWAAYCVLSGPPEPGFAAPNKAAVIAQLNHLFTIAAYAITWAIQLGYVAWLGVRWMTQKQDAARASRSMR